MIYCQLQMLIIDNKSYIFLHLVGIPSSHFAHDSRSQKHKAYWNESRVNSNTFLFLKYQIITKDIFLSKALVH